MRPIFILLFGALFLAGCTQNTQTIGDASATISPTSEIIGSPTIAQNDDELSEEPLKIAMAFFNLGEAKNNPESLQYLSSKSQIRGELEKGTYLRLFVFPTPILEKNISLDTPILEQANLKTLSINDDRAFIAIIPKNTTGMDEIKDIIENSQNAIGLVIMEKEGEKWLIDDIASFFGMSDELGLMPDVLVVPKNELKTDDCPSIVAKINGSESLADKCLKTIAMLKKEPEICQKVIEIKSTGFTLDRPITKGGCIFDVAKYARNSKFCDLIPEAYSGRLGKLNNDCYAYFAEIDNRPELCDKITTVTTGKAPAPERVDRCLYPLAIKNNDSSICEKMLVKTGSQSSSYMGCYNGLAIKQKKAEYCYKFPDYYNISSNIAFCLDRVINGTKKG